MHFFVLSHTVINISFLNFTFTTKDRKCVALSDITQYSVQSTSFCSINVSGSRLICCSFCFSGTKKHIESLEATIGINLKGEWEYVWCLNQVVYHWWCNTLWWISFKKWSCSSLSFPHSPSWNDDNLSWTLQQKVLTCRAFKAVLQDMLTLGRYNYSLNKEMEDLCEVTRFSFQGLSKMVLEVVFLPKIVC